MAATTLTAVLPARAATVRDERDLNTEKMLEELDAIESKRTELFESGLLERSRDIAAQSQTEVAAVKLWEKAIEATQFQGKLEDGKKFADWQDKRTEIHLDPLFKQAVKLHADYLVLTLNKLSGASNEELMPQLIRYMQRLDALLAELDKAEEPMTERMEEMQKREKQKLRQKGYDLPSPKYAREVLNTGLAKSPIVQWNQLESYLKGVKDWEMTPGNIEGILDQSVMPLYREQRSTELLVLWDGRIDRARRKAAKSELAVDQTKFENETEPKLQWSRAQDEAYLGYPNRARATMMVLVRNYPSHPDFDKWVKELRSRLGSSDGLTGKQREALEKSQKASTPPAETPAPADSATAASTPPAS